MTVAVLREIPADERHDPEGLEFYLHCPGCGYEHWIRAQGRRPCWSFNGDFDRPTFSPSLLVRGQYRCHSFIRDGEIQFLGDCDHDLAGQTVPLPELDDEGEPIGV